MAALSTVAFAHDFVVENGTCTVAGEVATSKAPADAYTAAKGWLNSQGFTQIVPTTDNAGKSFGATVTLNTKSSYNPFAGQFFENLVFTITVDCQKGKATYKCENIQIQEVYAGYGVKNTINPIATKINELDAAKKAVADAENDAAMSKKDKKKILKENGNIIKDREETLNKATEALNKRIEALKAALQ